MQADTRERVNQVQQAREELLTQAGLKLSPEFKAALHCEAKEQIITGGVRAGKSTVGAAKIFTFPGVAFKSLIWIVGPTYQAAEQEMNYLNEWFSRLGLVRNFSNPQKDSWKLELATGCVIETRSAEHTERLASVAPDYILVSEAGQCQPTVRTALLGRALEKGCTIVYTGTIETDDNKPRFAWFEQTATEWLADPSSAHEAISLPSWSNVFVFPGGEQDPKIVDMRRAMSNDPWSFDRLVGGKPVGAANPAYPSLQSIDAASHFIVPVPSDATWVTSVGGADWGVKHPWALVVISASGYRIQSAENLTSFKPNVVYVRECICSQKDSGDSQLFNQQKRMLTRKYGAFRWGVDPVQSSLGDNAGTRAVSGNSGSRDGRIGLVRSRLNNGSLLFDLKGPGVVELYNEMKAVRYVVRPNGKLELLRVDDDRTAALEYALETLDAPAGPPPAGLRTHIPFVKRRPGDFKPA